jgi:ABC-type Zn uptake system ZnuABC Zn-binding protein ZnuA
MNQLQLTSVAALLLALPIAALTPSRGPAPAGPLRVVCTLPDLGDITREIGGDRVDVSTLYKGRENTHALTPKPSHLVAMTKADVFVEIGLSLESSVVPGLLENCRNEKIAPGKPGFINVSEGWTPLDVPVVLSRKEGDVHPQGNPHMNMDPRAGRHMAKVIHDHLVDIDRGSKAGYDERYEAYLKKLEPAEQRWAAMGKDWGGKKFVVYHKEYDYLATVYGVTIQGSIEVKPGIPPTPNHVAELIEAMKQDRGAVIVTAPWSNNDTVARISEETGAKIVELPNMCGGIEGTDTWIGMMDLVHERVAKAFGTLKEKH